MREAGLILMICTCTVCCRLGHAAPPSGSLDSDRGTSDRVLEKNLDSHGKTASRRNGKFVRAWKVNDLRRELHRLGQGRSHKRGKELFKVASCQQCHRLNQVGGTLGPDLTGVAGRNSRVVILREIIEPSKQIPEQYQSHTIVTSTGKIHQGLVVRQDAKFVYMVSDVNRPDQLQNIPLDEIEEKTPSPLSIMPKNLLDTMTKEDILDLLAYIEAGGQKDHAAYYQNRPSR